ncbi:RNA polymerase sigma factor sigC [Aristolochia californica]|uniref:RNA polymerase sigma factor sigC n=1 Tax=Aristolochia californica TaxID=171875 RepID=UPI0035DF22C7
MGIRFFLQWKWVLPVRSPPISSSTTRLQQSSSSSLRSREAASFDSATVSTLSIFPEEYEICHKDALKPHTCSFGTLESLERNDSSKGVVKMSIEKTGSFVEVSSTYLASHPENNTYLYTLLMENLAQIEQSIDNSNLLRLERDILTQIDRLGALSIFYACLSKTIKTPRDVSTAASVAGVANDSPVRSRSDNRDKGIVRSVKSMERKFKRKKALSKASKKPISSSSTRTVHNINITLSKLSSPSSRRLPIARSESEMSKGVKDVANLERIRTSLEERIEMVSFKGWADAVGISEKELQQRLSCGWECRDRLLKSARSLVQYIARNYRGQGISSEDLVQAGNIGVLQGAERFDPTKGYQFSTYAQYWIRRSISTFLARHSRGIQMTRLFNNAMITTKKARKVLYNLHKRPPQDEEIAKFTGISIANIRLACKYLRVVGSIEQKVGDDTGAKFMEITPDASVSIPEEIVMRQHMIKEIYELLEGLQPREKQVLMLRYGLGDGRCKSLGEIGSLFGVSKEWIRKIERAALIKLRQGDIQKRLKHFIEL